MQTAVSPRKHPRGSFPLSGRKKEKTWIVHKKHLLPPKGKRPRPVRIFVTCRKERQTLTLTKKKKRRKRLSEKFQEHGDHVTNITEVDTRNKERKKEEKKTDSLEEKKRTRQLHLHAVTVRIHQHTLIFFFGVLSLETSFRKCSRSSRVSFSFYPSAAFFSSSRETQSEEREGKAQNARKRLKRHPVMYPPLPVPVCPYLFIRLVDTCLSFYPSTCGCSERTIVHALPVEKVLAVRNLRSSRDVLSRKAD